MFVSGLLYYKSAASFSSYILATFGVLCPQVCAVSFWARVRTEAQRYTHRHICTQTRRTQTLSVEDEDRPSYLQSQRFPSHVLEQSRGGGERALRAFLQRQGDARRVPTQQIHQVLQLPAHLVNNNSVMKVSTIHRHPRDSDYRNNKQIYQYEQTVSDWFRDSTFIPFTHDLDYFPVCLIHFVVKIAK